MKIAVFGGSFNPIHNGHLALADDVLSEFSYDKILFVPSLIPPHKSSEFYINTEDRLKMIDLACSENKNFILEDYEIRKGGISYTFETISYLQEKYKTQLTEKIALIIGSDLFAGFHLWKNAEFLAENCQLILARRPKMQENLNFGNKAIGEYSKIDEDQFDIKSEKLFENAKLIQNPILPISSTEIRSRISENKSFRYLVPEKVFNYIKERNLYGQR